MHTRGRMRRPVWRRSLGVVLALALGLWASLPSPAAAAVRWQVDVGAQSPNQAVQANVFLPQNIWVDVGDTVDWNGQTGEIHTVTFGPPPAGGVGAAAAPYGLDGNAHATLRVRNTQKVNSGFVVKGVTFSASFAQAGDYPYFCLVHAQMKGTVHVAQAGTPYPHSQAEYTAQGRGQGAGLVGQGFGLEAQGLAAAIHASPVAGTAVTAGIGQVLPGLGSIAVPRFLPDRRVVHVGQAVTWTNRDPETPHTVTFGSLPQDQVPPGPTVNEVPVSAGPPGGTPGTVTVGQATLNAPPTRTQWLSSGYIGADFLGPTFTATFDAPGSYPYYCALHDTLGMRGSIEVVP